MAYASVHHVTAAGHHEPDMVAPLEDFRGGLDEIFRTLLERDTAKEGNYLVLHSPFDLYGLAVAEVHCVVDSHHLVRRNTVFVYHDIPRELAHCDYFVSSLHTFSFEVIYPRIDLVIAAPVEGSSVDMHYERLACKLLCSYSGQICQPVMGMDDIEFVGVLKGDRGAYHGISCHLFHQVFAVFAGKLVFLPVLDPETFDLAFPLFFHHFGEILRVHIRHHIRADMNEPHLSEEFIDRSRYSIYRDITCIYDLHGALVLVT